MTPRAPAAVGAPTPAGGDAPLRWLAVETVRRELDRADRNEGRRGLILRILDALGIGYDS